MINIHVASLGGTISCIAENPMDEFYDHASINIESLVSSLPLSDDKLDIQCEQLLQRKSHEMSNEDLLLVANRVSQLVNDVRVDAVVIAQGTNSLEETAYFINLMVKTRKPIIMTGAMRPANSLGFDGARNLFNAIMLASNNKAAGLGVLITFNDYITSARDSSKFNPSAMDNFSANGVALLGYIHGSRVTIHHMPRYKHTYLSEFDLVALKSLPKIPIIYGHLGVDDIFVEAAIKDQADGIISAGSGKGYQPAVVTEALSRATQKGLTVVRCSRTGQGVINRDPGLDDHHGFIAGGSLNPQKARILLAVALSKTKDKAEIQRIFSEY